MPEGRPTDEIRLLLKETARWDFGAATGTVEGAPDRWWLSSRRPHHAYPIPVTVVPAH